MAARAVYNAKTELIKGEVDRISDNGVWEVIEAVFAINSDDLRDEDTPDVMQVRKVDCLTRRHICFL
jgi:hypothetical protein